MAYTPKTWQCDDTITADELNRMEQGIAEASQSGGGTEPLIVRFDHDERVEEGGEAITLHVYDKTWQEVHDALASGTPCYVLIDNADFSVGGGNISGSMLSPIYTAPNDNNNYLAVFGKFDSNLESNVMQPIDSTANGNLAILGTDK